MACDCSAASGQLGSRTSPMPMRNCSTSRWLTRRRTPPAATASSMPRYVRLRSTTVVVLSPVGTLQSGRVDAGEPGGGGGGGWGGGGVVVVGEDWGGAGAGWV